MEATTFNFQAINILDSIFEYQRFEYHNSLDKEVQKSDIFKTYHLDYERSLRKFNKIPLERLGSKLIRFCQEKSVETTTEQMVNELDENKIELKDNRFQSSFVFGLDNELDNYLSRREVNLEIEKKIDFENNRSTSYGLNTIPMPISFDDGMGDVDEGDISKGMIPKLEKFSSNLSDQNSISENTFQIDDNETNFGTNMRHSFKESNYKAELNRVNSEFNQKILPNYDELMHQLVQKKLEILKDEIKKLEIVDISRENKEKSRTIIICLSGFLSEDDDKLKEWKSMPILYPNNEILAQNWQATTNLGLVKESQYGVGKVIWPIYSEIANWTYDTVQQFWGDYNKKEDSVSSIAPTFEKNLEQFNKNFKKKTQR